MLPVTQQLELTSIPAMLLNLTT